jgi:predicted dehydrogenase
MIEWCDKLIDACKRTGMHYMMGETSYYRPQAMYCRRQAAEGAFGHFVMAEGEYLHDIDNPRSNLRKVAMARWGKDWDISKSGAVPMHYPTHSLGGFLSVMNAHVTEVTAVGYVYPNDDWHRPDTTSGNVFANETALFRLSNGATALVREYRRIGYTGREAFQLFGTEGSFADGPGGCFWVTKEKAQPLTVAQMRDPLPEEVLNAYGADGSDETVYGGHGGSHAYLVNEFVQAVAVGRVPTVNAWQAARYVAPGVMAHKSALKNGESLKVPDWGDPPA